MTKEQLEYAIGRMMSASVFSKAALSFVVNKGLASSQEVTEMLDISLLAFEQIEGRPGITNKVIFQLARADIEEFCGMLPDVEKEGRDQRSLTPQK